MTPAQDIHHSAIHSHHYQIFDPDGNLFGQGDVVHPLHVRSYRRPQSTSNPIRPDNTRRPSDWDTSWYTCRESPGGFITWRTSGWEYRASGQLLHDSVDPSVDPSVIEGQLRNTRLKALSQAVEKSTQLNAALAQSRDIVRMAADYTRRANAFWYERSAATGALGWRKSTLDLFRKYGRPSSWRVVPNEYLAYLYGIAPLGDDIANGLDRLTSYQLKGMQMSMLLDAWETRRESVVVPAALYVSDGALQAGLNADRVLKTRCKYRFDLPSWYIDSTPTVSLFSTGYELARYSFVLDWFLPVGSWIQALESAQFSPFFVEGSETWVIRDSCDLLRAFPNFDGTARLQGRWERGRMHRTALFEYPSSVLTRPSFKPFPGVQQVSQGLSLLAQAIQRWR